MIGATMLGRGRFARASITGAGLVGAAIVVIAIVHSGALAIFLFAFLGIGYAILETTIPTLIQRLASEEVLARAFGVSETGNLIATSVGSGLAPLLLSGFGTATTLVMTGALLSLVVLARRRAIIALDRAGELPERAFAALRRRPVRTAAARDDRDAGDANRGDPDDCGRRDHP